MSRGDWSRRGYLSAVGAASFVGLSGCTGGNDAPIDINEDATVSFGIPEDGGTAVNGVQVTMNASNFEIQPSGEVNANSGHFHVMVDTDPVAVGETIPSDDSHRHFGDGSTHTVLDLEPGEHRLVLQVGDGKHRALPLTDEVTVTVEEASVTMAEPSDGATVSSPVALAFEAGEGFDIVASGEVEQSTGHAHVMVDADPVPVGETIPSDDQHVHYGDGSKSAEVELSSGEHELTLQMGSGNHLALPATDTVTVTVE